MVFFFRCAQKSIHAVNHTIVDFNHMLNVATKTLQHAAVKSVW